MGIHHASPQGQTGLRVATTVAAAAALTGAAGALAGPALADPAAGAPMQPGHAERGHTEVTDHGVPGYRAVDRMSPSDRAAVCDSGSDLSVAGVDLPGLGGLCGDARGSDERDGFERSQTSDDSTPGVIGGLSSDGDRAPFGDQGDASEDRSSTDAGANPQPVAQQRPAAQPVQKASANPIDTPPPPGQKRIIKLPSTPLHR